MAEYLQFFVAFALESEKILEKVYALIRTSPPFNFIVFYLIFFYCIMKIYRLFQKEKVLIYKICDESEENEIISQMKKKNKEIIESLEKFESSKENEKKIDYSKKLENSLKEIASIKNLYTEFQEEIVDSHKSIIESVKMPVMKR